MANGNNQGGGKVNEIPAVESGRITLISFSTGQPIQVTSTVTPINALAMLNNALAAFINALANIEKKRQDDIAADKERKFLGPRPV